MIIQNLKNKDMIKFEPLLTEAKNPINMQDLITYALGIQICCAGEYGTVYFNPDENHVYITLGDANPFEEDYLKQFMLDAISKDYGSQDLIKISIEDEAGPNTSTGNWLIFDGRDKFVPVKP